MRDADTPELIVTNFNRHFTGVSATAAAVARQQVKELNLALVGAPLPGLPEPISLWAALRLSRHAPPGRKAVIWHVRRNAEMQAALFARGVLRLPIRIVFTSAAQRRHSAWPRWLISRMDAIIAATPEAAGYVGNVWSVVPHGVDTDAFRPAQDRAAAWAATGHGGTLGIAAIGRVRPEKGTDLFVDAMIRALPDLPGATALVIGRAAARHQAFEADLRARIHAAGLTDRIRFTGELAPADMAALMPALSLLVALPRYEGYGMTPLEAMACAVPVVASDAGYFREFLGSDPDPAGTIVPLGDSAAAAAAACDILRDPTRQDRMQQAALTRARGRFGIETEVAGIRAVYDRLWAGKAP